MRAFVCAIFIGLFQLTGYSQGDKATLPDTIYVNTSQTILIVFGADVAKVDIGSKGEFFAQIDANTVLVKVANDQAKPTSLYIRFGNDFMQSTIAYSATKWKPMVDLRKFSAPPKTEEVAKAKEADLDKQVIDRRLGFIEAAKERIKQNGILKDKITFALKDVMQDENNYYFKLLFINKSKTVYDVDFVEFTYKTPRSEDNGGGFEIFPGKEQGSNQVKQIYSNQQKYMVYAISKYALSKSGSLSITSREKNGSRRLDLTVSYTEMNDSKNF